MNDNICNVKKQRRQCVVDEGEKAGTIGGLLGKNVFVSTSARLKEKIIIIQKLRAMRPLPITMTEA